MTHRRRLERASREQPCGRCESTISVDAPIRRDRSGRAHHEECLRLHVTPPAGPAPERFDRPNRPAEATTCPGCGTTIHPQDVPNSVPVFGTRWHRDCRHRAAGRR